MEASHPPSPLPSFLRRGVLMDEDNEFFPGESFSEPQPRGGVHYLAKCVLKGSAVLHAARGHLRSPTSPDIVLGKETSIELVVVGEDGTLQSICEQTVFGLIKDLAILPSSKKLGSLVQGKDLLIVLSDSGNLTFLIFCTEMDRFFPLTHIQLSGPGNGMNQLGRMLAVDLRGFFIAVSAYEDQFTLLSVSLSNANVVEKKISYPPENVVDSSSEKCPSRNVVRGTIWSICFISKDTHQMRQDGYHPVIATVMHRRGAASNDLLLFGCNSSNDTIHTLGQYSDPGSLAVSITEVPHLSGFAVLFRMGDAILMDLSDPCKPCCLYRTSLNFPQFIEEFVDTSSRYIDVDDEDISACALLELRDSGTDMVKGYDPMPLDSGSENSSLQSKFACSWDWEPDQSSYSRLIFCLNTGELSMLEMHSEPGGFGVLVCSPLYKGLPCKALAWVRCGIIAAFVEMGDGMILKLRNRTLVPENLIENIAPILDMSLVHYHEEKDDQIFAGCGVGLEGSLRIIRNGVRVEKLLRTASVYHAITGIWTLKMKETHCFHSFLVLSFVEETRVLSVGLSFADVSDAVGFKADVCTLACGLLLDGLLVQIHRAGVRLCLPTSLSHPEGIPLSTPICTSWHPGEVPISVGAIGHNLVVLATSNPCIVFVLGVRTHSAVHYEMFEIQRVTMHSELSCISIPRKSSMPENLAILAERIHNNVLPAGVEMGKTFVIGTHKPSVEVLTLGPDRGIRIVAVGDIAITNASGIPIVGCIPEDARLVFVDRCYMLAGLRNGMLLRFEWPITSSLTTFGLPMQAPFFTNHNGKTDGFFSSGTSPYIGLQCSTTKTAECSKPVILQLIAVRRIGVSPVCLVPLEDSLGSDMIALSDRPWLLRAAKHSLSYTSISFQPATHATPVTFADCPKGILFVVDSSLLLVEMCQSKRLNVQKFHVGGTPRKVLYHSESKTLLVMRVGLTGDSCSSDICRMDPASGLLLARFRLEPGETAKCMEIVRLGKEQVLIVGTSQTSGRAIMPSGEAERAKGRLLVISLDSRAVLCGNPSSTSQFNFLFQEIPGYATEHFSSSSHGSSPEEDSFEGVQREDLEAGHLRLVNAKSFSGVVLSVCAYLDHYLLVSAGNNIFVFGFLNENPHRLRKFSSTRTRFTITCLSVSLTRIAAGDCRDGVLIYYYHEDQRKLELLYCDPMQRLVADCILLDQDTVVASDRRGSISILSSSNDLEDDVSPECNLIPSCSYYMGETAMTIGQVTFSYRLPLDDDLKCSGLDEIIPTSSNIIIASTLLGSVMVFIPVRSGVYELLKAVEDKLAVHPLTAPVLGNDHDEFRRRGSPPGVPTMLDGDLLAQFLELTSAQQELVISSTSPAGDETSSSSQLLKSISEVVQLLERIHYALS